MKTPAEPPRAGGGPALDQLRDILAFVFDVSADSINATTCLRDLPQWSSLSYIVLMTAIESRLHIQPDRVRGWAATTVGDLLTLLHDSAS